MVFLIAYIRSQSFPRLSQRQAGIARVARPVRKMSVKGHLEERSKHANPKQLGLVPPQDDTLSTVGFSCFRILEADSEPSSMSNPFQALYERQTAHFHEHLQRSSVRERRAKLRAMLRWIKSNEDLILKAVHSDLGKPRVEAQLMELKPAVVELKKAIRELATWMADQVAPPPLYYLGTKSYIKREPKGVSLIIAPWNFPFQLAIGPLISAVAAGNAVMIKPSEMAPATTEVIKTMISALFPEEEVAVIEGSAETAQQLTALPFAHIYFTGSPQVGKLVMKAAAEHLTGVTLELGGCNPCVVDESADFKDITRKILWGKFANCGQSCVSINHVFVPRARHDEFVTALVSQMKDLYGSDLASVKECDFLGRIINERHLGRVVDLMERSKAAGATLAYGGEVDESTKLMMPTLLTNLSVDNPILHEEVFGPLLSLVPYDSKEEVLALIRQGERPLCLYLWSKSKRWAQWFIDRTVTGTVLVNDTKLQFLHPNLPFGGINQSGLGAGHGEEGFLAFTHQRAVMRQKRGWTIPMLVYAPHTNFKRWVARITLWRL